MSFILILGLAGFASAFATRAVDPMLTLVASDLSVTLAQAALLSTAFTLPYAAMQLVFGTVGDAVGKIRLIRVTLLILTLALVACAFAPSHPVLMAARMLSGAWAGGVIPVAMATVGDRIGFAERPKALSRLLMAVVSGQLSGAVVSGLIASTFGWRAVFFTGAAVALAAALGAIWGLRETAPRQSLSWRGAFRRYRTVFDNPLSIRLFGVSAVEGALIFGCFPFVAAHMLGQGLGNALEAGLALGAFGCGGIFYALMVSPLVRRLGLSGMAGAGGAGVGLCLIAIALATALPMMLGLFVLAGFCFYMIHNTLQIMATELVPAARGSAVALYATFFFTGQALGAWITAQVVPLVGPTGMFIGAGCGLILLAWPASRLPLRIRTSPPEAKAPSKSQ
ncbi:MAG: MFS transporter [Rhizobiales bacterium 32-66-8]|nr:MAG: MFS transporter [Rhizobiales bacterium 32-66-8]